jgi:replicative DNA helicase
VTICNFLAERVVLGTILAEPSAAFAVERLTDSDFSDPGHRMLFMALALQTEEGRIPSLTAVAPSIRDRQIHDRPALQVAMEFVREAVSLDELASNLQILKEYSGRRAMLEIASQMELTAKSPARSILTFNEGAAAELDRISTEMRYAKPSAYDASEWVDRSLEAIRSGVESRLINTGFADLNRQIGGWARGEVSIIAGRSSMGKTTALLSSLRQATMAGVTAIMFSLEMSGEAVAARMISDAVFNSQTPIPYTRILDRQIDEWDLERMARASAMLRQAAFRIDAQRGLSISDIAARARCYQDELDKCGKRLDVLAIDHIGFVRASGRYAGSRHLELGEISFALKELSERLDVAVVVLCQLNRDVEKREDKRPQLSDLRESGRLEEDADTVIFAFREAYYLARIQYDDEEEEARRVAELGRLENVIEFICAKRRNGPTFSKHMFTHMPSNAIRDRI